MPTFRGFIIILLTRPSLSMKFLHFLKSFRIHKYRYFTVVYYKKESANNYKTQKFQRERFVFSCMIKNLFEEYKYFPQYPEKELHVTAQLFGGIIEHALVNMVPLGLALR